MFRYLLLRPQWALPLLALVGLFILTLLTGFNGLFGQDAHEYLRQSQAVLVRFQGGEVGQPTVGDATFAGGLPFWGAILALTGLPIVQALQLVAMLSAALCVFLYVEILQLWVPGAIVRSRWVSGVLLLTAPFFIRMGIVSMSDMLAVAGMLGAIRYSTNSMSRANTMELLWAGWWAGVAVSARFAMIGLLSIWFLGVCIALLRQRHWLGIFCLIVAGFVGVFPHFWVKWPLTGIWGHNNLIHDWSVWHWVSRSFGTVGEGIQTYWAPNLVHVASVWVHPAFCLALPFWLILFKRTDLVWPPQRWLLASLIAYSLMIAGLPVQSLRFLLPAWVGILILLYPSIDRTVAYGAYFTPQILRWVLIIGIIIQVGGTIYYLRPVIERQRQEQAFAQRLRPLLQPNAQLYSFEVDIALKTYLPDYRYHNLWERRYDQFPSGAYLFVNPDRWAHQWANQNPMLNLEIARAKHAPKQIATWPDGWQLLQIE
jgi:hypothetical protein